MIARRKYPDELRERAIRLTGEARKDPAPRPAACMRIGEQLRINLESLRGRVVESGADNGVGQGVFVLDHPVIFLTPELLT